VIAFVDADDAVATGWLSAVVAAFAGGADLVEYEVDTVGRGDLVSRYIANRTSAGSSWSPPWPEALHVQGGWFAIRRAVFDAVGGFDPDLHAFEEHDFILRSALAGTEGVDAPGARYDYRPRRTALGMIRQRGRWAYWQVVLRQKYRGFPFVFLPDRRILRRTAIAGTAATARLRRGDVDGARLDLLDAASLVVEGAGIALARADLALHRRPRPRAIRPQRPDDALVGGGLPPGPSALLVGDEHAVTILASALRADLRLGAPPAGLVPTTTETWSSPAVPARQLVDLANRRGWALPRAIATRRLEVAPAPTHGEAVVALHAVHAWLGRKGTWIVAAGGAAGGIAAAHLPAVPIVAVGSAGGLDRAPAAAVSVEDLRRDPVRAVQRLAPALGLSDPERVGAVLRLLLVLRWPRLRDRRVWGHR
jgi:hypothetical protein